MKTIQLVGTRNKSDFAIFFSHVLVKLEKRVLIVDATSKEIYGNGFARSQEDSYLYDFQNIDLLVGAKDWLEVEQLLRVDGESTTNYDVIILDTDQPSIICNEWPTFDERFYIGDDERLYQMHDVELLNLLFDETKSTEMKRIIFKSNYDLTTDYFDNQLQNRATWRSMAHLIEQDEFTLALRIQMGHEQIIPFPKLNKQYKEVLMNIASEIFQLHIKEIQDALKPSFFRFRTRRNKEETQLEQKESGLLMEHSK